MKNFIFILFLFLSSLVFAQWQKQGIASGVVNDMTIFNHIGINPFKHIGTASGIFSNSSMYPDWDDESLGLIDNYVKKLSGLYNSISFISIHTVLTDDGVYAKSADNSRFIYADDSGLDSPLGGHIGYQNTSGLAVERDNDERYNIYLSIYGYGIYKRAFCLSSWCPDGNPIFFDNAEGANYWEVTGIWHRDKCRAKSPTQSWKAGADDYPTCTDTYPPNNTSYLTMIGYVDLGAPGHNYKLRFWENLLIDNITDQVKVQVQPFGGSWEDLASYNGYHGVWEHRVFSLKKYSGPIKIRFVFTSNSFYEYEGWYIDDIEISKDAPWSQLDPQVPNPYVTDIYFYDDLSTKRLYATTITQGSYYGYVYSFDGSNWTELGDRKNYLSIDGPPFGSSGKILAGTSDSGVYENNGSNFYPFCNVPPPTTDSFIDVSVDAIDPTNGPFAAVTNSYLYRLNSSCSPAYEKYYYNFDGIARSVLANCADAMKQKIYVGTNGLGLLSVNCNNWDASPELEGNETPNSYFNPIRSKNISSLAIGYDVVDDRTVFFASSLTDGMYKSISNLNTDNLDYYLRYFYDANSRGTQKGTCVAIVPDYNEKGPIGNPGQMTIFLGTKEDRIFKSNDGGSTWERLNYDFGSPIVDIVLANNFLSSGVMFALTMDAKIFISYDYGNIWSLEYDISSEYGTNSIGFDLEISPFFSNDGVAFVASNKGLFKRTTLAEWIQVFNLPSLAVSLSPIFDNSQSQTDIEAKSVLVGTFGNGAYYSTRFGDSATFYSVFDPSSPFYYSNIPVIRMHPKSDLGTISGQFLYTVFLATFIEDDINEGIYEIYFNGDNQWTYNSIYGGELTYDFRISDIQFHPAFSRDQFSGKKYIYASHKNNKIFRCEYNTWNWIKMYGFYHTPKMIYSISENPENSNIIIAGTKGYGPMISFDGGISYFPWGSLLKDNFVMHDVLSVSFTNSITGTSRIIASSGNCSFGTPACNEYYGIYYSNYTNPSIVPGWQRAYLCLPPSDCSSPPTNYLQDNFNGHLIKEIRYTNLETDIEAADYNLGPIMSDPAQGGAFGKYWQVDLGGDTPESLSDISYPMSLGPGRGTKAQWVWGASGLSSGTLRASDPGAYKWTETEGWSLKNGSGSYALPYADWRAVYSISETEVLIGSGMADGNGIYRTEDGGQRWVQSNRGLDDTSKIVKAFTGNSNYIFVALEETPPVWRSISGSNNGGIYMSDCQSKGYAWVYYSEGLSCNSTYELSAGSKIYTGSTCDGIYGFEGDVHINGNPVAMFSFERNNPWNEREVQFTDRSAGLCTENCVTCPDVTWVWWCDEGFLSFVQNPSHLFSYGGNFNCSLNVNRGSNGDTYFTNITIPEVTTLKVEKSGSDVKVSWQRLAGDESLAYKYNVYRDTSAQGTGVLLLQTITPPDRTYCDLTSCWYIDTTASGSNYYYRVFTE